MSVRRSVISSDVSRLVHYSLNGSLLTRTILPSKTWDPWTRTSSEAVLSSGAALIGATSSTIGEGASVKGVGSGDDAGSLGVVSSEGVSVSDEVEDGVKFSNPAGPVETLRSMTSPVSMSCTHPWTNTGMRGASSSARFSTEDSGVLGEPSGFRLTITSSLSCSVARQSPAREATKERAMKKRCVHF